jgi:UDP-N-acetyl-alpha-D-muramoyl-L-alanyl-L-glutamate epimerase
MNLQDNFKKFIDLRAEYPVFVYESYDIQLIDNEIIIRFSFNLNDSYWFYPETHISVRPGISDLFFKRGGQLSDLNIFAFNIGMIELISYWKTACSPRVIIKPHTLDQGQIDFWKKIYFNGLGEFFYLNGIMNQDQESFMEIVSEGPPVICLDFDLDDSSALVPIGGGKDSVVTLELLRRNQIDCLPLILNPRGATLSCVKAAGYAVENVFIIKRTIHPLLLELNEKGFLNGHTPFSAMLGFNTILAAVLSGRKHIALSNESSANESTVEGSSINHQYSKSFEFEEDFRNYVRQYISPKPNYFSFLRPVSELQIAELFSQLDNYHDVFRSCNAGSKTDSWCGNCPKCLFTYTILSPFLSLERLSSIFGKDLFSDLSLKHYLRELTGMVNVKPFECVGTVDEVNASLQQTIGSMDLSDLPSLLDYYYYSSAYSSLASGQFKKLLLEFESEHNLEPQFESILKNALS